MSWYPPLGGRAPPAKSTMSAIGLSVPMQSHAARWPSDPTDARGNPIDAGDRGQIIDLTVRAWNPATPLAEPPIEVNAAGDPRMIMRHLEISPFAVDANAYDDAIESAESCARHYQRVRTAEVRVPMTRPEPMTSTANVQAYSAALRAAEAFVTYMDAVAAADGTP
jgi:hypothetical protein